MDDLELVPSIISFFLPPSKQQKLARAISNMNDYIKKNKSSKNANDQALVNLFRKLIVKLKKEMKKDKQKKSNDVWTEQLNDVLTLMGRGMSMEQLRFLSSFGNLTLALLKIEELEDETKNRILAEEEVILAKIKRDAERLKALNEIVEARANHSIIFAEYFAEQQKHDDILVNKNCIARRIRLLEAEEKDQNEYVAQLRLETLQLKSSLEIESKKVLGVLDGYKRDINALEQNERKYTAEVKQIKKQLDYAPDDVVLQGKLQVKENELKSCSDDLDNARRNARIQENIILHNKTIFNKKILGKENYLEQQEVHLQALRTKKSALSEKLSSLNSMWESITPNLEKMKAQVAESFSQWQTKINGLFAEDIQKQQEFREEQAKFEKVKELKQEIAKADKELISINELISEKENLIEYLKAQYQDFENKESFNAKANQRNLQREIKNLELLKAEKSKLNENINQANADLKTLESPTYNKKLEALNQEKVEQLMSGPLSEEPIHNLLPQSGHTKSSELTGPTLDPEKVSKSFSKKNSPN